MNIALCFAGEPRFWQYGYKNIQHLKDINPNINIDVFIHTWDTITYKSEVDTFPDTNISTNICYNKFITTYNPVAYKIENKNILDSIIASYNLIHLSDSIMYTGFTSISQIYSTHEVHKLRMNYETEHNISYDIVFHLRTDLLLNPSRMSLPKKCLSSLSNPNVRFPKIQIINFNYIKLDHNIWCSCGNTMNDIFSTWDVKNICQIKQKSNTTGSSPVDYTVRRTETTILEHIISRKFKVSAPLLKTQEVSLNYHLMVNNK